MLLIAAVAIITVFPSTVMILPQLAFPTDRPSVAVRPATATGAAHVRGRLAAESADLGGNR
jgi:hypothetical protein